ncbi:unnamed protein product [Larinioides sclopetarius]|uniref:Uncharacterized protein n=1 Tax=Larinioides sclopetarius TaxID=280406 RepID=A0AAV1ZNV8_9ARAC
MYISPNSCCCRMPEGHGGCDFHMIVPPIGRKSDFWHSDSQF